MGSINRNWWFVLGTLVVIIVVMAGLWYFQKQNNAKTLPVSNQIEESHVGREYQVKIIMNGYKNPDFNDLDKVRIIPSKIFVVLNESDGWWYIQMVDTTPSSENNLPMVKPWKGWIRYEPKKIEELKQK